ncbi:MAG: DedA family protein [Clostridiales bacterium]|jgi:membrane-associated protein|nr:DedA family protein [Clostridiales bacterium]
MEFIQYCIDFILHITDHLEYLISNYGGWVYAILFLIIFCETGLVVTPFLPGDSLLFAIGALSSTFPDKINVHLMALALICAAVLGDATNYAIGRFFGKKLFSNPKSKIFKQSYLDKTHNFFEKYGGKTIILARFVPIVRTFAPFVAGMGRMSYLHFASYNVVGGVVWVALFTYVGHFFGSLQFVKDNLEVLLISIIFISLLPGIIEVLRARYKAKKTAAKS